MTYLLCLLVDGQVLDFSCPAIATTRLSLVGADLSIVGPLPTKELLNHSNSSPLLLMRLCYLNYPSAFTDCSLHVN